MWLTKTTMANKIGMARTTTAMILVSLTKGKIITTNLLLTSTGTHNGIKKSPNSPPFITRVVKVADQELTVKSNIIMTRNQRESLTGIQRLNTT